MHSRPGWVRAQGRQARSNVQGGGREERPYREGRGEGLCRVGKKDREVLGG
ncbi:hypothetical protein NEUTE2DRAFT_170649 [Neurospora tetrasperma FGSC 2509]|nr:hypothetical protein NEUTE2DRAFT_170649 [Neurospora tetrasperma FGSC 2509]